MMVSKGLIKTGKDFHLIGVQEGGVPQLMRSMGVDEGARGRMISWHGGRVSEQSKGGFAEFLLVLTLCLYAY